MSTLEVISVNFDLNSQFQKFWHFACQERQQQNLYYYILQNLEDSKFGNGKVEKLTFPYKKR